MRNRIASLKHDSYGIYALTDANGTVKPIYRGQGIDIGGDQTIEELLEIGNDGIVQHKENTPVYTLTIRGNLVAKEFVDTVGSEVTAVQWLGILGNHDSVGTQGQAVFSMGKPVKYHISGGNHYSTQTHAYITDDCCINLAGALSRNDSIFDDANDAFGFEFVAPNRDKKMVIKYVGFYLKQGGSPTGYMMASIQTDAAGVPSGNTFADSNRVDVSVFTGAYVLYIFTFPEDFYMTPGTTYHVTLKSFLDTYVAKTVSVSDFTVAGNGNYEYSPNGGAWINTGTKSLEYTVGWYWELDEYNMSAITKAIDTTLTSVDPDTGRNSYPCAVDIFVPIKGLSELQRVRVFHSFSITSTRMSFNVDGVQTWESGLEGDNQSIFYEDRKVVDISSHQVTSGEQTAQIVNLSATYSEVYEVYLNNEIVKMATSATDRDIPDAHKWTQSAGTITFSLNSITIKELDMIKVSGNPLNDPTWASYRLVSTPGDQGGLYKGEVDIALLTDTSRPRVIEGLKVLNPANDDSVIQILQGTCYLKNTTTDELELYKFYESLYYTATTIPGTYYLCLTTSNGVPLITTVDQASAIPSEYELILASVTIDGSSFVSVVSDKREFLRSRLSLIQSADFGADFGREVVQEIGNERDVARSLNTPVPVTVDVTAKDTDEELNVLIHDPSKLVDSEVASVANISYTTTTLVHAGKDFTAEALVKIGDVVRARGSKAIVTAIGTTTLTFSSGWFGGTPPVGHVYTIYEGILKAKELDDDIGVQVNFYLTDDRSEYDSTGYGLGDKRVVVESIQGRTASDSLSISVGGDGEMSFSLNSDNLRVLYVAQALA